MEYQDSETLSISLTKSISNEFSEDKIFDY